MSQISDPSLTASTPQRPVTSTPNFIVRSAQVADAPIIAEFNIAMAGETEDKVLAKDVIHAGVRGVFEKPERGQYLCAERDGTVIGCLMLTREWSDWRNGEFWWIQSVYVAPDSRRQGVYQAMYAHAWQLAEKAGNICGFRLYVEKENERAQDTYNRQGMEQTHYLIYEQMTGEPS